MGANTDRSQPVTRHPTRGTGISRSIRAVPRDSTNSAACWAFRKRLGCGRGFHPQQRAGTSSRKIIVGVNYDGGTQSGNANPASQHYVVIDYSGTDNGRTYYHFKDPGTHQSSLGTSPDNKLYLNSPSFNQLYPVWHYRIHYKQWGAASLHSYRSSAQKIVYDANSQHIQNNYCSRSNNCWRYDLYPPGTTIRLKSSVYIRDFAVA